MAVCRLVIIFVFYCLMAVYGFGQDNVYRRITRLQGLPSDYVTAIYFDSGSVCWIGTDKGMCRYDGSGMQVLDADNGLSGNFVNAFIESGLNKVWVGVSNGGLSEVQYRNGKLQVIRTVFPQRSVTAISLDNNGFYWVVTKNSSPKGTFFWRTRALDKEWIPIVSSEERGSVVVDTTGRLWFDRNADLKWYNNYSNAIAANDKFPNEEIKYLAASGHRVCIATADSLYFFAAPDFRLKYQVAYKFPNERPAAMGYLATPEIDCIYRISNGAHVSGDHNAPLQNITDKTSLSMAFTMACDRNGISYVSDFGKGLFVWQRPYMKQYETNGLVKRIAFQREKTSFCTEDIVYTVQENNLSQFKPATEKIHFIAATDGGQFFISEHNRLIRNGRTLSSPHETFYDFSDVIAVGRNLFISSYTFGLLRWTNGTHDYGWKPQRLPGTMLERLTWANGKIFALTLNHGLFQLDTSGRFEHNYTRQQGLLSNSVFDVHAQNDTLWIATSRGLNAVFGDSILRMGTERGFVGNRAICVFRDAEYRLWVLSDKYLHHYANGRLYAIRSQPVLTDDRAYISTARFNYSTNTLWIGMDRKALAVDMSAVRPTHSAHNPTLTYLKLGENDLWQNTGKISLSYNHEPLQIGLSFSQTNLLNPPEIYYRFKGLDDAWVLLEKNYMIQPSRLPPGTYKLEVKSVGPDYGSAPPLALLTIKVSHPWWKQIWFLLVCIFFVSAIAFAIGAVYNRRRYKARLQALKAAQAVELERTRISRELHDNVGSMLTLMVNRLNDSPKRTADELGLDELARSTLSQLRDAIWALDQSGLTFGQWNARTNHFLHQLSRKGLKGEAEFNWPEDQYLSPIEALHTFRIVQEACANAIRHGKATAIKVYGTQTGNGCLELQISDNGRGFDVSATPMGYGLRNMQKRSADLNGRLTIESDVHEGTTLRFTWCPGNKNTPFG